MTGCIVGWAHTKFGKHEALRRRSPDRRGGARRRSPMPASRPPDIDEIYLGTINGGFVEQDFPASLVLQADPALPLQAGDPGRERLRHRLGGDPSGPQRDRGRQGARSCSWSASRR